MLNKICKLARKAGENIIEIYDDMLHHPVNITHKLDNSPVTAADIAAHKLIVQGLKTIDPNIPVLSEENPPNWEKRQYWNKFWLVDPLDGTKEFIKHNGEFTVNIALIQQGEPILGVVYAPKLDILYYSFEGKAWKEESGYKKQIQVRKAHPPVVVISRSHQKNNDNLIKFLNKLGEYQSIMIGSSLKFCLVAEGKAQFYPRFGPTNIWDTGAGHAIALAAGAYIYDWNGNKLNYAPQKSFLNFGFCVSFFNFFRD